MTDENKKENPEQTEDLEETQPEEENRAQTDEDPGQEQDRGPDQTDGEESAEEQVPPAKEEEDLQTQLLRLRADFQNFRRRTEARYSEGYSDAGMKFTEGLLEVLDNFERALDAAGEKAAQSTGEADDKFVEGMELICKQLQGVLEKNGVTEIEALGKPFDPKFHNAVMTEEAPDAESGTVTKVFQKGYMLKDKLVRPAMVAVAQ